MNNTNGCNTNTAGQEAPPGVVLIEGDDFLRARAAFEAAERNARRFNRMAQSLRIMNSLFTGELPDPDDFFRNLGL